MFCLQGFTTSHGETTEATQCGRFCGTGHEVLWGRTPQLPPATRTHVPEDCGRRAAEDGSAREPRARQSARQEGTRSGTRVRRLLLLPGTRGPVTG